ncbi:uncharacterized protein K452DRAFT_318156 [Neofusicoccum parvum]|nr:uncharacterized protein K452DRAFT_318156 [Neofusicoccum parvum]
MAILPRVPGISVEVRVYGEPLEEFFSEDEEDTTKTATRYVEATSGDIFTIHWTYHKSLKCRHQDLNDHALVDGKRVSSAITWSTDWMDQDSHTIDVTGVCLHEQGDYVKRDMIFSEVKIGQSSPPRFY